MPAASAALGTEPGVPASSTQDPLNPVRAPLNPSDDPLGECAILLQESEKCSHDIARVRLDVEGELFQEAVLLTSQV